MQLEDSQTGDVLVSMRASGIYHTDVAAVRDARTYPVVLGHEGSGVVAATGPGVTPLPPATVWSSTGNLSAANADGAWALGETYTNA